MAVMSSKLCMRFDNEARGELNFARYAYLLYPLRSINVFVYNSGLDCSANQY